MQDDGVLFLCILRGARQVVRRARWRSATIHFLFSVFKTQSVSGSSCICSSSHVVYVLVDFVVHAPVGRAARPCADSAQGACRLEDRRCSVGFSDLQRMVASSAYQKMGHGEVSFVPVMIFHVKSNYVWVRPGSVAAIVWFICV